MENSLLLQGMLSNLDADTEISVSPARKAPTQNKKCRSYSQEVVASTGNQCFRPGIRNLGK